MTFEENLQDVNIRERQLEAHILRSTEYLKLADQTLKRQVSMLYLAIALLLVIQGLFTLHATGKIPLGDVLLTSVTSLLAIINCFLLIQTKTWLHRLNQAWLKPEEKAAIDTLRHQRHEIIARFPRTGNQCKNAELN